MSIIEKAAQRLAEKQGAAHMAIQPGKLAGVRDHVVEGRADFDDQRLDGDLVSQQESQGRNPSPAGALDESVPPLIPADTFATQVTTARLAPSGEKIPDHPAQPIGEHGPDAEAMRAPGDFSESVGSQAENTYSQPALPPMNELVSRGAADTELPSEGEWIIRLTAMDPDIVLSLDGGRTRLAEEFRIIKRPLLLRALETRKEKGRYANLIMVTSAMQGEGKTFVSLNLAISIAMEMDSTVLLIDADVARPGLSKLLGSAQRPGLIERLTDEHTELADLLIRTDIPKLTILPAGERHKRSTELLASSKMQRLLNEVAVRYPDRIVLFDSPPLLVTTEAAVLAGQMGQVVLVVESDGTSQVMVKEALSQFNSLENVSLVLNKYRERVFPGRLAGYGYGYGYGYYGDGEPQKNKEK